MASPPPACATTPAVEEMSAACLASPSRAVSAAEADGKDAGEPFPRRSPQPLSAAVTAVPTASTAVRRVKPWPTAPVSPLVRGLASTRSLEGG